MIIIVFIVEYICKIYVFLNLYMKLLNVFVKKYVLLNVYVKMYVHPPTHILVVIMYVIIRNYKFDFDV